MRKIAYHDMSFNCSNSIERFLFKRICEERTYDKTNTQLPLKNENVLIYIQQFLKIDISQTAHLNYRGENTD